MALSDNKRLLDLATRQQIYVEGVKAQFGREFNFVLAQLRDDLKKLLGRVKYKTLDGMSKAELNAFVISLRKSQSVVYSNYTTQILEQLREFMTVDLEVSRRVIATSFVELNDDAPNAKPLSDSTSSILLQEQSNEANIFPLYGIAAITSNSDKLWSSVINAPIPANGFYLTPFVKGFAVSAQASVENIIRKAWANGWTIDETLTAITGEDNKQGASSQLQKIGQQAAAVIGTAVQHTSQIVYGAVASAAYARYQWLSVMDSHTSNICIDRNGQIYIFGRGPLPPGHILCRSHIAGVIVGNDDNEPETLYTFLRRQPQVVLADLFGSSSADEIQSDKFKAKDSSRFTSAQPLTLAEFRSKVAAILSR